MWFLLFTRSKTSKFSFLVLMADNKISFIISAISLIQLMLHKKKKLITNLLGILVYMRNHINYSHRSKRYERLQKTLWIHPVLTSTEKDKDYVISWTNSCGGMICYVSGPIQRADKANIKNTTPPIRVTETK